MTKQEKIQEEYGNYWEAVKDYINEDGIIDFSNYKKHLLKFSENMVSYDAKGLLYIPKSLQGIENNRGWIKVESEDDLPKELTDCFIRTIFPNAIERLVVIGNHLLTGKLLIYDRANDNDYSFKEVTHYQPIVKPQPPIY